MTLCKEGDWFSLLGSSSGTGQMSPVVTCAASAAASVITNCQEGVGLLGPQSCPPMGVPTAAPGGRDHTPPRGRISWWGQDHCQQRVLVGCVFHSRPFEILFEETVLGLKMLESH